MRGKVVAGIVVFVLGFGAGWLTNGWRLGGKISDIMAEQATKRAEAVEQVRQIEREQRDKIKREVKNAREKIDNIKANSDGLADTIGDLRQRLRQRPASCDAGQAAAADGGQDQRSDSAGHLPADLPARIATDAAKIAKYADRLRVAGETCESIY